MRAKSASTRDVRRDTAERRALIRTSFGLGAVIVGWVCFVLLPHASAVGIGMMLILFLAFKSLMTVLELEIETDNEMARERRPLSGAVAGKQIEESSAHSGTGISSFAARLPESQTIAVKTTLPVGS